MAALAADELASYEKTAHLLELPANARRLLEALRESLADKVVPFDFAELHAKLKRSLWSATRRESEAGRGPGAEVG